MLSIFLTVSHIAAFGFGYAVRGRVRKELVEMKTLALSVLARLKTAYEKDESALRADVKTIIADIRKKF